jgi:cobalamin biosynthesis Mg chelatase CobN
MRSTRLPLAAVGVVVVVAAIVLPASPALAACHAFTVTASPGTVDEGAPVTITVSRDAAVAPSNIDVETVDESATAGADYAGVTRRTIAFTNDTQQSLTVATIADAETEGPETFRVHLSNPGGCAVNPNFSVGPDVRVTIADTTTTTEPPAPTTSEATTTAPGAASESTTTATTVTTTISSTTATSTLGSSTGASGTSSAAVAKSGGSGGGSTAVVILAALIVLAAGGAAFAIRRRQMAAAHREDTSA